MENYPDSLRGKHIVLGVSGGISCYKTADLVRKLVEAGSHVHVVMTAGAQRFVTDLTFQALSGNPVHTDLLDPAAEAAMGHIELARLADAILIAPASANLIARLSHGFADDLLTTVCLASEAPLFIAPAMNRIMWSNPATQNNVAVLVSRGITQLGPDEGSQACGETGAGRMMEPLDIRRALADHMAESPDLTTTANSETAQLLKGVNVLLTAGPTREQIDPVRFLSNNSSGKMGFAIAERAAAMGANVTLVAGPVQRETPAGVKRIDVKSATQMCSEVLSASNETDIFIAVAAVADYRPADIATDKIKKKDDELTLQLTRTEDILASVAALPNAPFCVGFAAETRNMEDYARGKLEKKKLDMIAANPVVQNGQVVFGSDQNSLEIFWPEGGHAHIPSAPKPEVARLLLELVASRYHKQSND